MAARIRLRRTGTTKRPSYRVVVADNRTARDGRFVEAIGFYDPLTEPPTIRIDAEKAQVWLKRGALPSNTVRHLLRRAGVAAG
jgi:small subunit ribosomal protein S16